MSTFTALNGSSPKTTDQDAPTPKPRTSPDDTWRPLSSHKRKRSGSPDPKPATPPRGFRPASEEPEYRDERAAYDVRRRSPTPNQDGQPADPLRPQLDQHSDYSHTSPDAEDRSAPLYGSPYAAEHGQDSAPQHDAKKRKRNFSNRTKTGCLTCRKRKKKCDEHKPECSNCVRGGFVCAGYPPQRGPGWQKPDSKTAAVPLESKDPTYVPPGAYGMPQPSSAYGPTQPVKREPLPHYRGQALRIDPPQARPLAASDDERPTASSLASASATSPETKLSAVAFAHSSVFPTPVSANTAFGERMAKEYPRVPPLHDAGREPDTPHALPQINILHPTRASSPTPSSAQVAAQLALSHPQYPQRRTQKEEMLSGRHYYPFDKELCLERERCALACWRFNNLTTPPANGVSPDERARLFLDILQPRDPVRVSPTETAPVTNVGRVGRHVAVETPFTCDYGYNISIGHHVVIGRNCTVNDVCEVKIGDNCVIGPNVSIFTASLPIDPKKRQGGQGPQLGKPVAIDQDCWIGGGAMILPGRTIGKGSTVGAGSIVTKDVPPFTVVAGNPARVLRGIGVAP